MMQPRSAPGHERARPPVLVIDDVEATRTGLAELLRMLGYDAYAARDGAEGLQILRDDPGICAVVLDLRMPGTSGYWFREQQLKDPSIASIPVIVFTGMGKREEITESLKVSEVLYKPLSVDRLLEAISRCCQR
jgi:CheY-like chemotaxis protein